ncbi:hypothetical protein [Paenibacillus sp. UMB4589-SE434]|uniref:hypothetical protein n=1 Tax=Paenibacillus sp. UMB4589-SE434 TaxID=3046314 RepID=UPI00254A7E8B|nr:hypothetical protein [Paenibacillus sp. UMB4589-SE434]MDK8179409.1 hypothetical protein [Paenibacillus sp. UMB4589-SE434]
MSELRHYLELNDPVAMVWRKGNNQDPFTDRNDLLPVINGIITLLEIPSSQHKVHIDGMVEINQELYNQTSALLPDQFLVNYANGSIQFHPQHEGATFSCKYKGKGLILYPASRIYAMVRRHPDVVKTLQEIIDEAHTKLNDTHLAMDQVEQAIREAHDASAKASMAADRASQATANAMDAAHNAIHAVDSTKLLFKPAVSDMKELLRTHLNPQVGWTVQTYKDGIRYRYDGKDWVPIDIFGKNIQLVNEHADGLMSSSEHSKLKSIPLETKERVIVFCLPSYLFQGVQNIVARFPFKGEIVGIKAICGVPGDTDSEITIEKSMNMKDWHNIMSRPVQLDAFSHYDDGQAVVDPTTVYAGDCFRLHVVKQGLNIQNVTVEMIIKI